LIVTVIIDGHHHLWDPVAARHDWLADFPALQRRFDLADFEQASVQPGIDASVLVQVLNSSTETVEFLQIAAASGGRIAGVVGWTDLTSPGVADDLARLKEQPGGNRLVGIRHLVQDEPDPSWLTRPDVQRGLAAVGAAGLTYDLLVRPQQLLAAIKTATALPEVRFVLDHGAKPEIATGSMQPWTKLIDELSRRPNVSCKLSGLVTEAGPAWSQAHIAPYAGHLLDSFGPDRLMFGSDWPVCLLAASYDEVFGLARALLTGVLSQSELDAVFGTNAIGVYGLEHLG
jgi:L-fuconolactonase